jgi:rubrerythrin
MPYALNADEVFEMAEQMERNGAQFYRRAAGVASDDASRKLLTDLAVMEDDHEKVFSAIRANLLSPADREPTVYDPEDVNQQYLWAWADRNVFQLDVDPFETLVGALTIDNLLIAAIGREKDSIVFYEGLKGWLKKEADRDKLQAIIQEEMGHIALLAKMRKELK